MTAIEARHSFLYLMERHKISRYPVQGREARYLGKAARDKDGGGDAEKVPICSRRV